MSRGNAFLTDRFVSISFAATIHAHVYEMYVCICMHSILHFIHSIQGFGAKNRCLWQVTEIQDFPPGIGIVKNKFELNYF